MTNLWLSLLLLLAAISFHRTIACSDVLVTPKASADGSAMIAYNADDAALWGVLYHYPPTQGNEGEHLKVYDWDTGVRNLRLLSWITYGWM
jgi:dipeptidase